jgi:hypothetical protein
MKRFAITAALLSVALAAGCNGGDMANVDAIHNTATADGLAVTLKVPERKAHWGQELPVRVVAENTTGGDIRINATSAALVKVHVWERVGEGWDMVKTYPEAAAMVMSPWTLEAGQTREFPLTIPVERSWPTGEPVRLTAELNGWAKATPGGVIEVYRTREHRDRAKAD